MLKKYKLKDYKEYLAQRYPNAKKKNFIKIQDKDVASVIITPDAYEDIKNYFHIGRKYPTSMFEQHMVLIGFKINKHYIVKYVVPMHLKNHVHNTGVIDNEIINDAFIETCNIADVLVVSDDKDDFINGEIAFLGFIHSRPFDNDISYSDGEKQLHSIISEKFDYVGISIEPYTNKYDMRYGVNQQKGNLIAFQYC